MKYNIIFILVLVLLTPKKSFSKLFTDCEYLSQLLILPNITKSDIPTWYCIAKKEKKGIELLTSNKYKIKNRHFLYGIFSIPNDWCEDENNINNELEKCGKCSNFIDNDIIDDFDCASKIKSKIGFKKWGSYNKSCQNLDERTSLFKEFTTEKCPFYGINQLKFSKKTKDQILKIGENNQSIICEAEGIPKPNVTWDFGQKKFNDLKIQYTGENAQLFIPNVTEDLINNIHCKAENYFEEKLIAIRDSVTVENSVGECEFLQLLSRHTPPIDWREFNTWLCIVRKESELKVKNIVHGSGSRSYGIFSIWNGNWCGDETTNREKNPCGNCSDMLDKNLTNDFDCAVHIKSIHGFEAWNSFNEYDECDLLKSSANKIENCEFLNIPPPVIQKIEDKVYTVGNLNESLICRATGNNTIVKWEYDEKKLKGLEQISLPGYAEIIFPYITLNLNCPFTCVAENFAHKTNQTFYINIKDKNYITMIVIIFSIIIVLLITVLIFGVIFYRKSRAYLLKYAIQEFLKGNPDLINRNNTYEIIQCQPYNRDFEISKNDLQIDYASLLGEGNFGLVYQGKLLKDANKGKKMLAIKTLKKGIDAETFKSVLIEVKVMTYIGNHNNIVQFTGACTEDIKKGEILIATEYCEKGDLLNILIKNRETFIKEIKNEDLNKTVDSDYENLPGNNLSYADLCNWTFNVMCAMEHLESINVIHGDLATRNILITKDNIAKVGDFGLSRQLNNYSTYVKTTSCPLPWRWLALEALSDMAFSTKSDVWSYGVTLWEMFSLGEIPYAGMTWSIDFVEKLKNGLRLPKPTYASEFIYNMMYTCWSHQPTTRPTFSQMKIHWINNFKNINGKL